MTRISFNQWRAARVRPMLAVSFQVSRRAVRGSDGALTAEE
jgi:hypothetical protein